MKYIFKNQNENFTPFAKDEMMYFLFYTLLNIFKLLPLSINLRTVLFLLAM